MTTMIVTPQSVCDTNWYQDSGATNHLTVDAADLMTNSNYLGPDMIHMGN